MGLWGAPTEQRGSIHLHCRPLGLFLQVPEAQRQGFPGPFVWEVWSGGEQGWGDKRYADGTSGHADATKLLDEVEKPDRRRERHIDEGGNGPTVARPARYEWWNCHCMQYGT